MREDTHTEELNQFLTFTLGEEIFAVEINHVREVMDYAAITRVPRLPEYLRGVINLRGNVVSVIDLPKKLGMKVAEKKGENCIVIVEVNAEEELCPMGLLVDSVQEVIHFPADRITPSPKVGTKLNPEFIRGIAKRQEDFIIILDIDRILGQDNPGSER